MYVTRFPCNECAKLIIQTGKRENNIQQFFKYDALQHVSADTHHVQYIT